MSSIAYIPTRENFKKHFERAISPLAQADIIQLGGQTYMEQFEKTNTVLGAIMDIVPKNHFNRAFICSAAENNLKAAFHRADQQFHDYRAHALTRLEWQANLKNCVEQLAEYAMQR